MGRRLTIEQMQEAAKQRGGKCLSTTYKTRKHHLKWECSMGHQWETTYNSIHRGSWCPICSSGLYERICRCYFEQLFKTPFPNTKPLWLKNSRGNQMELDGYSEKLKLAFEHQGEQHYSTKSKFASTKEELKQRQDDDKKKKELCKDNGMLLICIPEVNKRIKLELLKDFIKNSVLANGWTIPETFNSTIIDLNPAYISKELQMIEKIKQFAIEKKGRLLSEVYLGSHTVHEWKCDVCQHEWTASPHNVINGKTWCPRCVGRAKWTIEDMKKLAEERGGKCLSKKYININKKLKWKCGKCEYEWQASAMSVKTGNHWCPKCAGQPKIIIERLQELAAKKGGRCLSSYYKNAHFKYQWKCREGHSFEATYANISQGKWCPKCWGERRKTKDERRKTKE